MNHSSVSFISSSVQNFQFTSLYNVGRQQLYLQLLNPLPWHAHIRSCSYMQGPDYYYRTSCDCGPVQHKQLPGYSTPRHVTRHCSCCLAHTQLTHHSYSRHVQFHLANRLPAQSVCAPLWKQPPSSDWTRVPTASFVVYRYVQTRAGESTHCPPVS